MRYPYTFSYILFIILANALASVVPFFELWGQAVSPLEFLVGAVYVLRDLSQREIKHYVLLAMLIATGLSYILADQQFAIASVVAFSVGELLDWGIYTYTKKPLSERLLWSSLLTAPIDTAIFLYLIQALNWLGMLIMVTTKILGVMIIWYQWRLHYRLKAIA